MATYFKEYKDSMHYLYNIAQGKLQIIYHQYNVMKYCSFCFSGNDKMIPYNDAAAQSLSTLNSHDNNLEVYIFTV